MTCYNGEFTSQLKANSEIGEIVWLTYKDKDSISPVDKLMFDDLYSKGLIKY